MKKLTTVVLSMCLAVGAASVFAADTMSNDSMSKDAMSKDAMKRDTTSKDAMSKDAMKKDAMSKDAMSKDAMKHKASQPPISSTACIKNECPRIPVLIPVGSGFRARENFSTIREQQSWVEYRRRANTFLAG